MAKDVNHPESGTRQHLLQAALKRFADRGYAATSVQDIVNAARVSKPALYYYFRDKAGLFEALVDRAHEERYRIMRQAAARGRTVAAKLEEIVAEAFEFSLRNKELMRLALATAFATSGEAPGRLKCQEQGRRNFDFIRSLIEQGQASGELTRQFPPAELARSIYGQLHMYVMLHLLAPDWPLDRTAARKLVRVFLEGALNRRRSVRQRDFQRRRSPAEKRTSAQN